MWTVARGYLRASLCSVFVDLFDEIGDSWYIHWAVMRLFAGEFMLYYCDFRWTTGHILQRIYMGVWEKTCKQALRLGLLVEQG